jgi:hypothetical protein
VLKLGHRQRSIRNELPSRLSVEPDIEQQRKKLLDDYGEELFDAIFEW